MSISSPLARRLGAAVSLLALTTGLASASAEESVAPIDDIIVVKSAPLQLNRNEITRSVDIIPTSVLERDLDGNLADTLSRLPGVNSTYFGPAAGRPIIRGLGADRVRVLINGLSGLDAASSSPDHAVTSEVLGAERVEVLRGPAAIAYGGAAIGGVVNVLDGRIPSTRIEDGPVDGFVYLGSTSVDQGIQAVSRLTADMDGLMIQIDGLRRDAGIFDIPGYAETEAAREEHHDEDGHDDDHEAHEEEEAAFGAVPDSDYTFDVLSGAVSLVRDWGFFGVSIKDTRANYGLPGHAHAHEDEHADEDHEDDHEAEHEDEHEQGEEESARLDLEQTRLDLRGAFNREGFFNRIRWSFAHSDYSHLEMGGEEVGTLFEKNGFEGRVEVTHNHEGERRGAWGVQILTQDFEADGEEAFIEHVTTRDWGVFITERWDYGQWGAEVGARYDARGLSGERASRDFGTFSVSASAFVRPEDNVFLAAALSRTERAPTDVEVFIDGPHAATQTFERGDLNLDTETAWAGELTARYGLDRLSAELNVFYASYDGFIDLFPTGGQEDGLDVFEYRQSNADLYGFEAAVNADLVTLYGWDVSGEASLDYVQGELDGGGELPRIPPLSSVLALTAEQGVWSVRGEARLATEQTDLAEFETSTDGYILLNADVSATPFEDHDVRLILGVRNIGDEEARIHTSFLKDQVPLPGRSIRLAVRAGF